MTQIELSSVFPTQDSDALYTLYQTQNGKCALSGVDLNTDNISIDFGGVVDEKMLVTKQIRRAKTALTKADFVAMCKAVSEANNG